MRRHRLLAQVLAVLSRRTPAFRLAPGQPATFGGALRLAWDSRRSPFTTHQDYDLEVITNLYDLLVAGVPASELLAPSVEASYYSNRDMDRAIDPQPDPPEHPLVRRIHPDSLGTGGSSIRDHLRARNMVLLREASLLGAVGSYAASIGDHIRARTVLHAALKLYQEQDHHDGVNRMQQLLTHLHTHDDGPSTRELPIRKVDSDNRHDQPSEPEPRHTGSDGLSSTSFQEFLAELTKLSLDNRLALREKITDNLLARIYIILGRRMVASSIRASSAQLAEIIPQYESLGATLSREPSSFVDVLATKVIPALRFIVDDAGERIADLEGFMSTAFRDIFDIYQRLTHTLADAQDLVKLGGESRSIEDISLSSRVVEFFRSALVLVTRIHAKDRETLSGLDTLPTIQFDKEDQRAIFNNFLNSLSRSTVTLDLQEMYAKVRAMRQALNDFTQADLTSVELDGVDLRGVQWSILTTRWPTGWETPILNMSVQINSNRQDLYEVRDDPRVPHTVRQ